MRSVRRSPQPASSSCNGLRSRVGALALGVALTACGGNHAFIGPLRIDVPGGWRVTSSAANNLQIANGTTGRPSAEAPGSATAVFDVYVDADLGPDGYRAYLREQKIDARTTRLTIRGADAEILSYTGRAVAGRQEAVFFPEHRVQIVYRAAFRNDDVAFRQGHAAFRYAVASIRFTGPSRPA
jgi:hypothetical protein